MCHPALVRLGQNSSSACGFLALRSCSARLRTLSDDVRPCIAYLAVKRAEVDPYLRKLPRLNTVSIHYGTDSSEVNNSLTSLHSILPGLQSLSLHHHKKNRVNQVNIAASIDNLSLWSSSLQRLELKSISTVDTGGSSLGFISKLTALRVLQLDDVRPALKTENIVGCTGLRRLTLKGKHATPAIQLDVSSCSMLQELVCTDYSIQGLDVSGLKVLRVLHCSHNSLLELDVSKCSALTSLMCSNNFLTSLDLTSCSIIEVLGCSFNTPLTKLHVSGCALLRVLTCDRCSITELDVSSCPALQKLHCRGLNASSLDVKACSDLRSLHADGSTALRAFDAAGLCRLSRLTLTDCCLTSINTSGCTALAFLSCQAKQ